MSDLTEQIVAYTAIDLAEAVLDDLILNYKEYNVELGHIYNIVAVIQSMSENVLRRAIGGKEREQRLTPRQTFVQPRMEGYEEEKKGFFGFKI
jgi:hypothetical protein